MKPVLERKLSPYSIVVAVAILLTALSLRVYQTIEARRPNWAEVTILSRTWRAEVADTEAKRAQGLSDRSMLEADKAMYFPMPRPAIWSFWMKDMRFPLDIIWIQDGLVVDVDADVPEPATGEYPKTATPSAAADAVLEINAGQAALIGITPGTEVKFRSLGK